MTFDGDVEEFDRQPEQDGRTGPSLFLVGFVVLVGLAAVFVIQNGESAPIEFLWLDRDVPIWLVVVVSIAVGILISRLLAAWWRRRRNR